MADDDAAGAQESGENEESRGFRNYERRESKAQRLDRNYNELLQELRVAQTGVQILFAFLLSIAFQQRFTTLDSAQKTLYVITLVSAAAAAVLLIAPAAAHRVLFRRHRKDEVVALTSRLAGAGLVCLAIAILSALLLILDFVSNATVAITITSVLGAVVLATWWLIPFVEGRRPDAD
jgi:hypothetical protein